MSRAGSLLRHDGLSATVLFSDVCIFDSLFSFYIPTEPFWISEVALAMCTIDRAIRAKLCARYSELDSIWFSKKLNSKVLNLLTSIRVLLALSQDIFKWEFECIIVNN